jgi:transcriptional regulator with XRE-family HTH domain
MAEVILPRQRLAAAVTARRDELRLTQGALARRAGVSERTVWDLEHGKRQPHPATLRAVLAALGMTLRDIAGLPAPGRCAPGLGWPLLPGPAEVTSRG